MDLDKRMKMYESLMNSEKAMPLLPTIVRLDGKAFHTLTRGLGKPYDRSFCALMKETAKDLMKSSEAKIAYTQSDEISLLFYSDDIESKIFFDGKIFKMVSVLASMCTAYFNDHRNLWYSESEIGTGLFDCRIFQVPTKTETCNYFIWREQDAIRNSILSLGQHYLTPKQLYKASCRNIQNMLLLNYEVDWDTYPAYFKYGSMFRKVKKEIQFSENELTRLPEKHEARTNPDLVVERSVIELIEFPDGTCFKDIEDRKSFIFGDQA